MAGTLILDDDLMVLQRKGDFDIKDDYYETNFPDQFPNIRIDTDIFHFTGQDLRYSVVEYVEDSGRFVRIDGDIMRGNLEIRLPFSGDVEDNPNFVLEGFRAGALPYSQITFRNRGRMNGFIQTIEAIAPTDSSTRESHLKVGKAALTNSGQIMMSGSKLEICALSNGASLSYITGAQWDPESNFITTDIPVESKRLSWDANGGSLLNKLGDNLVRWDENGVFVRGKSDTLFRVVDEYARYTGEIKDQFDVTNKGYVDTQDSKSIPLRGTREENLTDLGYELEQDAVTGPIDFTSDASLNATINNKLKLSRNDIVKLTIGGDTDEDVHLECDVNFNDNRLLNVPDPDDSNLDPDAKSAVPKRYVDAEVQELKDLFNNIADIASPPGMINAFTGRTAPDGWFICDGTKYKCGDWPEMFKALGFTQEQIDANPDEPFAIPDLQGRFLAQFGKLNHDANATNDYPMGNSIRNYTKQSTSLPNKDRQTDNKNGDYIFAGSHDHSVTNLSINGLFNSNRWKVQAISTGSNHQHHLGEQGKSAAGSNSTGRFYAGHEGELKTQVDGAHTHDVKMTYNDDSYEYNKANIGWTEYTAAKLRVNEFDKYTLPYAYTINWIIKHDN